MPNGLVTQHTSQLAPASIQHRLGHTGLGQVSGLDVADYDEFRSFHYFSRSLVGKVFTGVGDLGMDRLDEPGLSGPLGHGKFVCIGAGQVLPPVLGPVAQGRNRLKTKIDAGFIRPCRKLFLNLTLKVDVPSTPGVLVERARLDGAHNLSGLPEPQTLLAVDHSRSVDLYATGFERYPAKGLLTAPLKPTPLGRLPSGGQLFANSIDRVSVETKQLRTASGELVEVYPGEPLTPVAKCIEGYFVTVVPDKVDRFCKPTKVFARSVFYSVPVGRDSFRHSHQIQVLITRSKRLLPGLKSRVSASRSN